MEQENEGGTKYDYDRICTKKGDGIPNLIQKVRGELAKTHTRPVFASEVLSRALNCYLAKLHEDARRAELAAIKKADAKVRKGLKDAHEVLAKSKRRKADA